MQIMSGIRVVLAIAAASIAAAGARPALADEMLYGITFDNRLITIDTTDGSGELVADLERDIAPFGLADRENRLYSYDQILDVVVEIEPLAGDFVGEFDVGIDEDLPKGEGGIAFRSDGIGFLAGGTTVGQWPLWRFDIDLLTSVLIDDELFPPGLDGLDFDPGDELFGLTQTENDLVLVDQITGDKTPVGATDETGNVLSGFTFRPDGTAFGVIDDSLYIIDTGDGLATLVGDIGFADISGLSFLDVPRRVPEPTSLLLIMVGLAAVGVHAGCRALGIGAYRRPSRRLAR